MREAILAIPAEYREPHTREMWGRAYTVTPAVAEAYLGDGQLLLGVECMDTRPNYYLIRVDSGFFNGKGDIDEVIDALIDEFGERGREREYLEEWLLERGIEPTGENTDLVGNEALLGWPVLSLDSGYRWWTAAEPADEETS